MLVRLLEQRQRKTNVQVRLALVQEIPASGGVPGRVVSLGEPPEPRRIPAVLVETNDEVPLRLQQPQEGLEGRQVRVIRDPLDDVSEKAGRLLVHLPLAQRNL
jgi:hypothetical protein